MLIVIDHNQKCNHITYSFSYLALAVFNSVHTESENFILNFSLLNVFNLLLMIMTEKYW